MALPREARLAYLQGLHELSPDPEDAARDAEEFGIPYGEPVAARHVKAGQEAAAVLAAHGTAVETPDEAAHREWIEGFHLSHPSNKFDSVPRKSAEQKAADAAGVAVVKANIRPFEGRPAKPTE